MSDRPEEDENYRLAYRQIDDHAVAIGHICIAWASLENTLDQLIALLTGLDQQEEASQAVTSHIDMRGLHPVPKTPS
jgi:hypothetical protein